MTTDAMYAERVIRDARSHGSVPDLIGADLRGADLRDADLTGADMSDANLRGANLYGADMRDADLTGADMSDADLRGANLYGADLRGADLRGADLRGANLRGTDLHGAVWDGLMLIGLPSGDALLIPTPEGWRVNIGCWRNHTLDELNSLAQSDDEDDWPEARGAEIAHRRPLLIAFVHLCEAHIAANPDVIARVAANRLGLARRADDAGVSS